MKTKISTFLVITSIFFVFISGNVQAEGKKILPKRSSIELQEKSLELEDWMIDKNVWLIHKKDNTLIVESENNLELENWMINDKHWKNDQTIDIQNEKDDALKIEPWMINFLNKE